MMRPEKLNAAAVMARQKELLYTVYDIYAGWTERLPLVCSKGCADCCTMSVSMSSLEGLAVVEFIRMTGREEWLRAKLAAAVPGTGRPALTMNQFAAACLKQQETDGEDFGGWDFTPCIFLEDNCCTIYGVRPFGCRSFGSLVRCADGGVAELTPIHLAVNTVFTQMIEHLSCNGGYWGNMADILKSLPDAEYGRGPGNPLPAQPIPGFLLGPREKKVVRCLLRQFRERSAAEAAFGDLIDNFMSME